MLAEDSYYRSQTHLTTQQRDKTNYDHPDAIEESLLVQHIGELKSGQAVDCPVYEYETHDRSSKVLTLGPCEILLVEGILLLHRCRVRELADLSVFVDVPEQVCLQRRIKRDVARRGRSRDSIVEQYEQTVLPMLKQFVEPSKQFADRIYGNVGDEPESLKTLLKAIRALIVAKH